MSTISKLLQNGPPAFSGVPGRATPRKIPRPSTPATSVGGGGLSDVGYKKARPKAGTGIPKY